MAWLIVVWYILFLPASHQDPDEGQCDGRVRREGLAVCFITAIGWKGVDEHIDGVVMAVVVVLQVPSHGGALNRKSGFESASQTDRVMRSRSRNLDLSSRDGCGNATMGEWRRGHRKGKSVNWHLIRPSSGRFFLN